MSVERSELNVERSAPQGAVFLSYAREDTDAARRIAEALRSSGMEMWFDQAELRGGEAWDAKIKKQIRECALFLAVVSAHTQERPEGYFRREWKLAVERTNDMAAGVAFLVPVVIDETPEMEALVPEEFMRVQWTRLAGGLPTTEFVAQMKALLGAGRRRPTLAPMDAALTAAPMRTRPPMTALPPPAPKPAAPAVPAAPPPEKKSGRSAGIWVVLVVLLLAAGAAAYHFFLRPEEPAAPPPRPAAKSPTPSLSTPPQAADKSIAVLPFENRSDDKANAFFTDGIHEDILTNLAHIAELRVVSRTSVMEYRGTTKKIRQIGTELGVAWLLEGSVQRVGNKVRVTGQLIKARTDEHVWAQSYDRDLTDIFAIQAELAQDIVTALQARLSPQEKSLLARAVTSNPAAYDLFLRAREINRNGNDTREELENQEALLKSAVTLDPASARIWAELSAVHALLIFTFFDASTARLAKAQAAIQTAQKLEPDSPDVIGGLGTYYYYGLRDYPRALEQFSRLVRQWPNNYFGHFMTGLVQRRQGRWMESLANLRRAAELDPASPEQVRNLVVSLVQVRRYAEAIVEQERRVRLLPESMKESFELARLKYFLNGETRPGDGLMAGPIAERAGPAQAVGYRKSWAAQKGDLATAARLDREYPDASGGGIASAALPMESALLGATILAAQGDLAGARARVEKYPAELRGRLVQEPQNVALWNWLAQAEALLGHRDEALAAAHRAREVMPESLDALAARGPRFALAFAQAWTGDKAAACAELRQLLALTGVFNVHALKNSPTFFPLKGYPAFEALLNDPANNAPLF